MGRSKRVRKLTQKINEQNMLIQFYRVKIRLMLMNMFKWENLPDGITSRYIEQQLYWNGEVVFFDNIITNVKDTSRKLHVNYQCSSGTVSEFNNYNEPEVLTVHTKLYTKRINAEHSVLIRNNTESYPTSYLVNYYAYRLAKYQQAIDSNVDAQKFTTVWNCDEKDQLVLQNTLMDFEGGVPYVVGTKRLKEITKDINVMKTDIPFISDKLWEMKKNTETDLYNTFGINNCNTDKKERLNKDEVNSNNDLLRLSLDVFYSSRKEAVEKINEKWGLNIKVNVNNNMEILEKLLSKEGELNESIHSNIR